MFLRVRWSGRLPSWNRPSRLPVPNALSASTSCSVTVSGEPTIAYRPSTICSHVSTFSMNVPADLRMLASDRTDVYPGGWIVIPGNKRFTKYQRCSSYSRRACSSVSAT